MPKFSKHEVDQLNAKLGTAVTLNDANALYDEFTPMLADMREMEKLAVHSYASLTSFYQWIQKAIPDAPQLRVLKDVLTAIREAWPTLGLPDPDEAVR